MWVNLCKSGFLCGRQREDAYFVSVNLICLPHLSFADVITVDKQEFPPPGLQWSNGKPLQACCEETPPAFLPPLVSFTLRICQAKSYTPEKISVYLLQFVSTG